MQKLASDFALLSSFAPEGIITESVMETRLSSILGRCPLNTPQTLLKSRSLPALRVCSSLRTDRQLRYVHHRSRLSHFAALSLYQQGHCLYLLQSLKWLSLFYSPGVYGILHACKGSVEVLCCLVVDLLLYGLQVRWQVKGIVDRLEGISHYLGQSAECTVNRLAHIATYHRDLTYR